MVTVITHLHRNYKTLEVETWVAAAFLYEDNVVYFISVFKIDFLWKNLNHAARKSVTVVC